MSGLACLIAGLFGEPVDTPPCPRCEGTGKEPALKYAVATVTDQTISYLYKRDDDFGLTTKHPEAHLFDDLFDASSTAAQQSVECALWLKSDEWRVMFPMCAPRDDDSIKRTAVYWVEAVEDEDEFRAREDTW